MTAVNPLIIRMVGLSVTVNSLGLIVVKGDLSTEFGAEMERLDAPGVDSFRYRTKRKRADDLVLEVTEDFADIESQLSREADYKTCENNLCSFTVQYGNGTRTWSNAMVVEVAITQRLGPSFGPLANSSSLTTLITHWTLGREKKGESKAP